MTQTSLIVAVAWLALGMSGSAVIPVSAASPAGWTPQTVGVPNVLLSSVAFVDDHRGWAVGRCPHDNRGCTGAATIIHTVDGGSHWSLQASGLNNDLVGVFFDHDGLHGWAVGAGPVLITTDGATWHPAADSGAEEVRIGIAFLPDRLHGVLVAVDPFGKAIVDFSSDGGEHWAPNSPSTPDTLEGVSYVDLHHLFVAGEIPNGLASIWFFDGTTWTKQTETAMSAISMVTNTSGWAVGACLRHTNGDGPPICDGRSAQVLHTSDGGQTWLAQDSGAANADLKAVAFVDDTHGWAAGSCQVDNVSGMCSGDSVISTYNGSGWSTVGSGTQQPLLGVSFPDICHGWAVGDGGTVLAYTNPVACMVANGPNVTGVSPPFGIADCSGIRVRIRGANFKGATSVYFGSTPAVSFQVRSDGLIVAIAPVEPAGTVDVTVTTPNGTSPKSSVDHFTYRLRDMDRDRGSEHHFDREQRKDCSDSSFDKRPGR